MFALLHHLARRAAACLPVCLLLAGGFASPAAQAQGTLNFGLVPAEDPRIMVQDNQALMDALHRSIGVDIRPFVATDYNGVIEALRSKRLDLALLGPFSYVLAASVAEVEVVAVLETQKQGSVYHSLVIARKDRNLRSLADLKGRSFAFVDPSSTSGHLFPKTAMLRAGLEPDTDLRAIFAGSHDAAAIAVQHGKVDAAAVADGLYEAAVARNMVKPEEIAVIWKSEPIPGFPVVMRRDLPEPVKRKIRAAFLGLRDVPWSKGAVIRRGSAATDADFDVVRETARLLNLDLRKMK